MAELGPLGLHPLDKGISAFPQFPGYSLRNLSNLTADSDPFSWLDNGESPGEGGPGGPGVAGSTTSGMGLPGVGPTDGTTTGIGNLSFGEAASAFGTGALNGVPGVAFGNSIANAFSNGLSPSQAAQMGLQGVQFAGQLANGVNPASLIGNIGLKGLISLATAAQGSVGGMRGPTVARAFSDMVNGLKDGGIRGFFGLGPNTPRGVVDQPQPDLDVTFPDVPSLSDSISAAVAAAGSSEADGPTGPGPSDGGTGADG